MFYNLPVFLRESEEKPGPDRSGPFFIIFIQEWRSGRMRRRVSILLVMMTVFSLMFFSAFAETSHSDSFSPFTRTGDPATDIVNVAAAQLERSKSSLGYVDAWCSYFVGDCAKLIGQSSVIPFYGKCSDLYAFLKNSGAAIIPESNRQKGDLIFYWQTEVGVHAYYNHVGIMSDPTYCISGNMDNSYVKKYKLYY